MGTSFQEALDETNTMIINVIPSPTTLLLYQQYEIFTAVEEERIQQEETLNGARSGTRLFLEVLRKKDERAFSEFLRLLQEPGLQLQSLHHALSEAYRQESHAASSEMFCRKNKLLKDIPPRIASKLVRQLNVPDTFGKDWRGIADCLKLTHEQTVESSGKMKDMLDLMIQRNYKIEDLIQILKEIERYDLVELFTQDNRWLRTEEKSTQTEAQVDSCDKLSVSEEVDPLRNIGLGSKQQCTKSNQTMNVSDTQKHRTPSCASKQALIVANLNYKELKNLDDLYTDVKNLKEALENFGWSVTLYVDCPWKDLKRRCGNFVKMTEQSVALVYYAGHSVQILSENYLLPVDISIEDSMADIVLKSLKLSFLVQDLSYSLCSVAIIDSGYETTMASPKECIMDGLVAFEPAPLRSVVCLICASTHTRSEESRNSFIRCFTERLKKEPANLAKFFNEVEEHLTVTIGARGELRPVILSKTRDLLPIILNDAANVFEKPTETFLVKKSALILVEAVSATNNLDTTEYRNLYETLKTTLWEVINQSEEDFYKTVKTFVEQPDSEMKVIFLFGSFFQVVGVLKTYETFLHVDKSYPYILKIAKLLDKKLSPKRNLLSALTANSWLDPGKQNFEFCIFVNYDLH